MERPAYSSPAIASDRAAGIPHENDHRFGRLHRCPYLHHIHVGHFDLETDEHQGLGGGGKGLAPFEYYLASLSACKAITLRMYAERKGWNLDEFRAELTLGFDDERNVHVHRVLHSDQPLSDERWQRLLEIVANTPVTKAMREGAVITSDRGG